MLRLYLNEHLSFSRFSKLKTFTVPALARAAISELSGEGSTIAAHDDSPCKGFHIASVAIEDISTYSETLAVPSTDLLKMVWFSEDHELALTILNWIRSIRNAPSLNFRSTVSDSIKMEP